MISSKIIARSLVRLVEDEGVDPNKVATTFIDFANQNNLSYQLRPVLENILVEKNQRITAKSLRIFLAEPASAASIKAIHQYVNAPNNVAVEILIDERLIGGFIAYYDGKMYDASLKNNVQKLKEAALSV